MGGWQALIASLEADRVAAAAEAFAHGRRCLLLVHGELETVEDEAALRAVSEGLEALPRLLGGQDRQLVRVSGTHDSRTWWWRSGDVLDAQLIVDQARVVVATFARPWWRTHEEPR